MKHLLFILGISLFVASGFTAKSVLADNSDTDRFGGEWSCEANNTRRSGPYLGTGDSKKNAQVQALRACRERSFFPCWIVPGSCIYTE